MVEVARGTVTVYVDVVGTVVVNTTSTSEKEVTDAVVVAAVGTWVTSTVDSVETDSTLVVSVSTSNTVLTSTMEVVVVLRIRRNQSLIKP
jgi:hypothetical protein